MSPSLLETEDAVAPSVPCHGPLRYVLLRRRKGHAAGIRRAGTARRTFRSGGQCPPYMAARVMPLASAARRTSLRCIHEPFSVSLHPLSGRRGEGKLPDVIGVLRDVDLAVVIAGIQPLADILRFSFGLARDYRAGR